MTEGLDNYTDTVLVLVSECNQWIGLDGWNRGENRSRPAHAAPIA